MNNKKVAYGIITALIALSLLATVLAFFALMKCVYYKPNIVDDGRIKEVSFQRVGPKGNMVYVHVLLDTKTNKEYIVVSGNSNSSIVAIEK